MEGARMWNPITPAEVRPTALALHGAHTECGVWVHIERGEFALAGSRAGAESRHRGSRAAQPGRTAGLQTFCPSRRAGTGNVRLPIDLRSTVGMVSDPAILATQGDGVLLVIDYQNSRKGFLQQAVHSLEKVSAQAQHCCEKHRGSEK